MKDKIKNRLGKSFGPTGSFSGWMLCIAGILLSYYSIFNLLLLLPGAFLAFTDTSVIIDINGRRVFFSKNIFGILKFGEWFSIHPDSTLTIVKNNLLFRSYSRSNRSIDIKGKKYKMVLNNNTKNSIPIKFSDAIHELKKDANELAVKLNVEIV